MLKVKFWKISLGLLSSAVCSDSVGGFVLRGYLLANNSLFQTPAQTNKAGAGTGYTEPSDVLLKSLMSNI